MDTYYEIETVRIKLAISDPPAEKTSSSYQAVGILRAIYADLDADQEHFMILALDQKLHIRGYKVLFTGGQSASFVDRKVVFRTALLLGASRIVIAHNHPSGDPAPSFEDMCMTKDLVAAGRALELQVLDHIILGREGFFSFSDRDMLDGGPAEFPITTKPKGKRGRKKKGDGDGQGRIS